MFKNIFKLKLSLLGLIYTDKKSNSYYLFSWYPSIAVIVLKHLRTGFFHFATYINGILKLSFINSILPIAGLLLAVLCG
jgi:hypothetical protein